MSTALRTGYEGGSLLHGEPLVHVFDDFLSATEVIHLLSAGAGKLEPAKVSLAEKGAASKGRTGRNCWIPHRHDVVIGTLCERISTLVEIPLRQTESLQLIHYFEQQEYAPHFDAWDASTEAGQRCMARGGQRLVTCLMYLNDVDAGGGTIFPKMNITVDARKGRLLVFHNCHVGTTTRHPASLHGGMPVLAGEKWACNLWFRERAYW
ncbi:MAG: 2OG-Fe(II) oxygenase [Gammaproteobacteria bacterium]|nr:2OG-Fe(II) oxygenase [Gammaproteobacteria bacterium]MDP2139410.1 2OG-Fe(II) oxygenase [Gammaproteobacteria bacterium]MDP2346246.1 2OG-Fe(II) oxygenase [Gammaproteobacteria bacterium]